MSEPSMPVVEQPILGESNQPPSPADDAARTAMLGKLDSAETLEDYKALRAGTDSKADESDTAASRARDEKGRFSATARAEKAAKAEAAPDAAPRAAKPVENPTARKTSIQAEIDQATREKYEAERELTQIRAETARLKAERETAQPAAKAEPPAEKFQAYDQWIAQNPDGDYEDYQDARQEWRIERRFTAEAQKRQQAEAGERVNTLQSQHEERLNTAKAEKYPDWDAKAAGVAHIQPNHVLYQAVVGSERSDDLTYHLMSHPQEYAQLAADTASLPVSVAGMVRQLLEARVPVADVALSSGPTLPTRQSRANPPPKPVGGSPSVSTVDPEDMSADEWRARYVAKRRAQAEARR